MRPALSGLWRHRNFRTLWAGETVSLFGSQITVLALPLTAVLTLHATPAQMGVLSALQFAPFLLIGLFAGVWVDRVRRRPLMLMADLGLAALLGTVPVAAWLGVLHIELLYVVGLLTGVLRVFFDVSYQSFLPALVGPEDLVEGNSKLGVSASLAQVAGPGVAGTLVQLLTATTAILGDAASFLVSALCLASIHVSEAVPPASDRRRLWAELAEGVRTVSANPMLRGIAGCSSTNNFFGYVIQPLFVLYATRTLHFTPGMLGLVFGASGVGALVGAVVAARAAHARGLGRVIIGGITVGSLPWLVLPLVGGERGQAVTLLAVAWFVVGLGGTVYNINQLSLRQTLIPDRLLGRTNATMRFLVWGTIPLGSLLGGVLAERLGVQRTLALGAGGVLLGVPWVLFSPLRTLRTAPVAAGVVTTLQPDDAKLR